MDTENGIQVDIESLNRVLEQADLITIGFTRFPERLLVDPRTNATDGTFCGVVEPVGTVQERFLWLGKHRGSFGAPQAFAFFVWPHSVRLLIATDALAPLRSRLEQTEPGSGAALDVALARLRAIEVEAIRSLIRGGEGWATVWERPTEAGTR